MKTSDNHFQGLQKCDIGLKWVNMFFGFFNNFYFTRENMFWESGALICKNIFYSLSPYYGGFGFHYIILISLSYIFRKLSGNVTVPNLDKRCVRLPEPSSHLRNNKNIL